MIVVGKEIALAVDVFSKKADEIHLAVLNLAASYGIFHGMNEALKDGRIASRKPSQAIGVIQNDLIHIMVVRVCSLCDQGARSDDASMAVLMKALDDHHMLRDWLIEKDRRWRRAMLSRSPKYRDAPSNISILMERWEKLLSEGESLRKIRHLRNKKLGHLTTGFEKKDRAVLKELWTLLEYAFDVAESIRAVFVGDEYRYRNVVEGYKADGRGLIEALHSSRDHMLPETQ